MSDIKDPSTEASAHKQKAQKKPAEISEAVRLFGDNLYKERTSRRMKQSELHDLSGINIGTISAAEKGTRNLNVKAAERLAKALDKELASFFLLEKDKQGSAGYAAFIRNFNKIRTANEVSVIQIAEKTGLAPKTIHEIENGENCTLEVAERLAKAIGIPLYKLFLP